MFENIAGNELIKVYLRTALQENRLPQTMLFSGLDGVGKSLFAREIAAHLLGNLRKNLESHPDFHLVSPEGKIGLFAIETIREMIDKEHEAPFEGKGKVFILESAERMQPASANALLKTLEEPSPGTTFILLSSAPQEILPTILSRCIVLSFQPLAEGAIGELLRLKGHPERLAKLSCGSAGRAFELALHPELEEVRSILFHLLAQKGNILDLQSQLEKIEELVLARKEEDPISANCLVEHLFASVLMWHRDQLLHQIKPFSPHLFFPEEPPVNFLLPRLSEVEKKVEEARLANSRNMKLSICLNRIFSL
ncbi:MAG: AAA family ATPase [Chlamydiota bacterium]